MKVILKNIGVFKQAEYELGQLTIICGENNTGKTYATYSLYGFFDFWRYGYIYEINDSSITQLINSGSITISLPDNIGKINEVLDKASKQYSKYLSRVFAAPERNFENSHFQISSGDNEISILDTYSKRWRTTKSEILQITKDSGRNEITASLLIDTNEIDSTSTRINLTTALGQALKEIIFVNSFPNIFIASAERTGAVIFKNDLNFEQSRLIKEIAGSSQINLYEIADRINNSSYALPVKKNLDFIRKVEDVIKTESYIAKFNPELLSDFEDIIGGDYKVGKEGLYYTPKTNKSIKLSMGESSSSVRSLLDIGFYLRHIAEKGDILMIDEPELNLHPCNQRRLAKLFARLINVGVNVFITTHSDYIIKELNTLIMLNATKESEFTKELMRKYSYIESELINSTQVKVYISEIAKVLIDGKSKKSSIQTLVPAEIDSFYGIEARSFDKTILQMNEIQESIVLGR